MNKEREASTQALAALCKRIWGVEYERDGLQSKLQRAKRKLDRCANAVIHVQNGAGHPQKLLSRDSLALQQNMEDYGVQTYQQFGELLAESESEAREDQTRDASGAVGLYV